MLFNSKRKANAQQASEALSIAKADVAKKLAELSDTIQQAESTFKEASAASKAAVEKLKKISHRGRTLQVVSTN